VIYLSKRKFIKKDKWLDNASQYLSVGDLRSTYPEFDKRCEDDSKFGRKLLNKVKSDVFILSKSCMPEGYKKECDATGRDSMPFYNAEDAYAVIEQEKLGLNDADIKIREKQLKQHKLK
jgi:hypothetical protein